MSPTTLSIAEGATAGTATAQVTYDDPGPRVAWIVRTGAARQNGRQGHTNEDALQFQVRFNKAVANVDAADFVAVGSTATATAVTGSGNQYVVTLSGGDLADLEGTVSLGFANGQNIANTDGNALTNTVPTGVNRAYVVDNTAPAAALAAGAPATGGEFDITVTFTEANALRARGPGSFRPYTDNDLVVTNGSVVSRSGPSISGETTVYTVGIAPDAGFTGNVTVTLPAGGTLDLAGNRNTAATQLALPLDPVDAVQDQTDPRGAETPEPESSSSSSPVDLFDTVQDQTWPRGGTVSLTLPGAEGGDGNFTYELTGGTTSVTGELTLPEGFEWNSSTRTISGTVAADEALGFFDFIYQVTDGSGRTDSATFYAEVTEGTAPTAVAPDSTAPTVSSIERHDGTNALDEQTNADSLTFRVTFSEDVENVDTADFGASGTTATATGVTGSGDSYVVTVSGGNLAGYFGTVGLTFEANQNIADAAGNDLAATTPSGANESYTLDNAVPGFTHLTRHDGTNPVAQGTTADELTFLAVFNDVVENLTGDDFVPTAATGGTATTATVTTVSDLKAPNVEDGRWYLLTLSGGDLEDYVGDVGLALKSGHNITDLAGNAVGNTAATAQNEVYTVNGTGVRPSLTANDRGHEGSGDTSIAVTINFGEGVTGFEASEITMTGAAALSDFQSRSGGTSEDNAARYVVQLTASGTSAITVTVPAGVATDATDNPTLASETLTIPYRTPLEEIPAADQPGEQTYTVDTAITNLVLPEGKGGDGSYTYALGSFVQSPFGYGGPLPAGLSFDSATRTLSGTPTTTGGPTLVGYTITDSAGASLVLQFTITVAAGTAPAATQTLVSTLGQSRTSANNNFSTVDAAQAFTTGDNAGGYTLTAVDVNLEDSDGNTSVLAASIWSATAGGQPDTSLGDLTNPGSVDANSVARFTTSGIDLDAETTYVVVFDSPGGQPLVIPNTDSSDEDAGAASGWSVADDTLWRDARAGATTWSTFAGARRITIYGTVKAGATEAPSSGLEARFGVYPSWHDGNAFWTELHFSADPDLDYKALRDTALAVTGARITRAQRIDKDSKRSWRLRVEPRGFDDISLALPATVDCTAEGAVCTAEGEPLETELVLAVPGPGERLAARLKGTSSHTGEAFRLKLHFSQEPELAPEDVRDALFAVTGGRITQAERLAKGSNAGWRLTVAPDSVGDVGLALPATEDCAAEGAVCTAGGERLERGVTATVAGPAAFSVSDAEVEEGPGAALAFEVSLSRRLRAEARVDVSTQDGTATAGSDYEAVTRTLVFAPGETLKVVEVPVLDDAHDEGSETMTLVLSNAQGAPIDDGKGTGTIVNSDAIPQAWLARFGRTVTGQVLDAVEERLTAPRQAGMKATLGGQALPSWTGAATPGPGAANDNDAAGFGSGSGFGVEGGQSTRTVSGRELLLGTSFALTAGSAEGGGHASLWGRMSVAGFDGREDALSLDGQVTTGLLGADWASDPGSGSGAGRWTAGLVLGHSVGTGGYRNSDCEAGPGSGSGAGGTPSGGCGGEIEAELTGLYPYARVDLNERVSVWLAAGHGAGELTVIPDGQVAIATDLTMSMGAAGTRIAVLKPEGEGLRLALKGDGRFTRTSSDAAHTSGGNLAAADADVWLLRFGLEGSWPIALGTGDGGASLMPSFEIGVRRDGGDAETGFGADMGGGVALSDPKHGLRLDLKGRALVVHEASGFREWGASVEFGWDPSPLTDRGLAMSLTQSWGASPSGGMDGLLNRETLTGLAANDPGSGDFEAQSRLSGELGYGLAVFGGGFTGTPNLGFGMSSGGARDWRLGWRLTSAVPGDPGFEVNLDATWRESANDDAEHAVTLETRFRW